MGDSMGEPQAFSRDPKRAYHLPKPLTIDEVETKHYIQKPDHSQYLINIGRTLNLQTKNSASPTSLPKLTME